MNICMINHTFGPADGQGRVNYEIARYLAQKGHRLTLIATRIDPRLASFSNVAWREVKVPARAPTELLRHQVFALGAAKALRSIRAGCREIVHVNGGITYARADVNVSHFVHSDWLQSPCHTGRMMSGAYAAYQRCVTVTNAWWERRAYGQARRVVAVSPFVRDSLVSHAKVAPGKIDVIHNGVDAGEFRPLRPGETNALRAELGVADTAFLAFFCGGIRTNRKNLDLPLRAIARLGNRFHLAVAGADGGGPYPAMARALGIAGRVHFLGHRGDVAALLRGADAFAFASHYDPYALVIPEAMASGVPVITAPTVGASCLIRSGENGFVLQSSGDLDGMVTVLARLAADPEDAARIGGAGRAAAERLSWQAVARRYEALYEQVAAGKTKPRPGGR